MNKPFDAATKQLVEAEPLAWLSYLGLDGSSAELMRTDLTTVTADADVALKVEAPVPYFAHIEFQSTYESGIDQRMLRYNVLIHCRHHLPVQSVLVLLRPDADGPGVTGAAGYHANNDGMLSFRYRVVRVWKKPVGEVLAGGLATLPLAPLADVARDALPDMIRQMEHRIARQAEPQEAGLLWTATYLLMGLRYSPAETRHLLKGVRKLKESSTYQALVQEAGADEARKLILLQGAKRFGSPDARTRAKLASFDSLDELERLAEKILEVESWSELLS